MWFAGVDFTAHVKTVDFKAQYLRGAAPGRLADDAYGLDLRKGAYAEIDWMATPMFGLPRARRAARRLRLAGRS